MWQVILDTLLVGNESLGLMIFLKIPTSEQISTSVEISNMTDYQKRGKTISSERYRAIPDNSSTENALKYKLSCEGGIK